MVGLGLKKGKMVIKGIEIETFAVYSGNLSKNFSLPGMHVI